MDVIVIESETFQEMHRMYQSVCRTALELGDQSRVLKAKVWITAKEAAQVTGYNEKTIRNRKHEIGFRSDGGLLLFKTQDVVAWMELGYVPPKRINTK